MTNFALANLLRYRSSLKTTYSDIECRTFYGSFYNGYKTYSNIEVKPFLCTIGCRI